MNTNYLALSETKCFGKCFSYGLIRRFYNEGSDTDGVEYIERNLLVVMHNVLVTIGAYYQ